MLAPLPRWRHLAEKIAAGAWQGFLKGGGTAGREPWPVKCHCPQTTWLTSSRSRHGKGPAQVEDSKQGCSKPLKEWTLIVSPFGQLKVRLPCHVSVCSLDPHRYPNADRVFVTMSGTSTKPPHSANLDDLHVKYDEALTEMAITSSDIDGTATVDVRIPVKFDLDIKTTGTGSVKIEQMDCDSCRIETEKGSSILQSIKSQKITIQAHGGDVISLGNLQGNAGILVTQESNVTIEKLQGSSINISTKDGSLKTKYLYAESSFLSSATGDVLLGNVHGDTTIRTETGNITIDSAEGFLKASTSQGKIDVYVISHIGDVDLKSQKGSITVKVPSTLKAYVQMSGSKVDVSPEIQLHGLQSDARGDNRTVTGYMNQQEEKEKCIKAATQNGRVHLRSQTWFQSVKLKAL